MDGEIWVGEIYLIADSDSVMKFRPQILQHIVFKLAVNNLINVYNWVNVNKNLAGLHYRGYFLISQLLIEFDLPDPKACSLDIHGCLDFHITYSLHDCFHQEKINCFLNRIAEVHFTFSTHLQTIGSDTMSNLGLWTWISHTLISGCSAVTHLGKTDGSHCVVPEVPEKQKIWKQNPPCLYSTILHLLFPGDDIPCRRHNSFTGSVGHFGNQCQGTVLSAKLLPLASSLCWGEFPAQISNSGQDRLHTSHLDIGK